MKKISREYFGVAAAYVVAAHLIKNSASFQFEPGPMDVYVFDVKEEHERLMPNDNVGRDALSKENGVLTCKHCRRRFEDSDEEGLSEGDPCPSDDCSSHDLT